MMINSYFLENDGNYDGEIIKKIQENLMKNLMSHGESK